MVVLIEHIGAVDLEGQVRTDPLTLTWMPVGRDVHRCEGRGRVHCLKMWLHRQLCAVYFGELRLLLLLLLVLYWGIVRTLFYMRVGLNTGKVLALKEICVEGRSCILLVVL